MKFTAALARPWPWGSKALCMSSLAGGNGYEVGLQLELQLQKGELTSKVLEQKLPFTSG